MSEQAPEPENLNDVQRALSSERNSPGPDIRTARNFSRRVCKSGNEGGAMQALLPKLLLVIDKLWDSRDDALSVNQQWDRRMLLRPDLQPPISPPKPDQALGFSDNAFPYPQAVLHLKPFIYPASSLTWPYLTVEAKSR